MGDRLFLAGSFALVSLQRYSFQMARRTRRGTAFVGSESSVIQRRNSSGTPLLVLLTPPSLSVPVQDLQSISQDYVQLCKSTGGTHPGPRISIDHALPKTRGLVLPDGCHVRVDVLESPCYCGHGDALPSIPANLALLVVHRRVASLLDHLRWVIAIGQRVLPQSSSVAFQSGFSSWSREPLGCSPHCASYFSTFIAPVTAMPAGCPLVVPW